MQDKREVILYFYRSLFLYDYLLLLKFLKLFS